VTLTSPTGITALWSGGPPAPSYTVAPSKASTCSDTGPAQIKEVSTHEAVWAMVIDGGSSMVEGCLMP
jgi:hypothetical protein